MKKKREIIRIEKRKENCRMNPNVNEGNVENEVTPKRKTNVSTTSFLYVYAFAVASSLSLFRCLQLLLLLLQY